MSGRFAEFADQGCDVLAINTDTVETHQRWLTTAPTDGGIGQLQFPLASDTDGAVCRQYGVYLEQQNLALRGLFIIDPNGVLQYQVVHGLSVGRSTDETLRVLDALQSGGLCPAERQAGQPTLDVRATLGPNRVIGQYRIDSEIGSGAFGTVFRAQDQLLDRSVALKVLQTNGDEQKEALLAEARAAAALNHQNVCTIHSIDTSQGVAMIVMEYVEGESLSQRLASRPASEDTVVHWLRQIASGMAAAHEAGVVHGDLKPANLVVRPDDSIKIMDFGLARRMPTKDWQAETLAIAPTSSNGLSGTPGYMAPEMIQGAPPTPASDVFAVGLVAYELLTGNRAVKGDSLLEVLNSIQALDAHSLATETPESVRATLLRMLAPSPDDRITMAEMSSAI